MEEYQEDFIDDEVLRTDGPTPKPISPTKVNENSDITSQRIRRIQKLHLNQVLCMEEEIFYQLDILPTTIQEESSKLSKHNRIEMPSSLTDVRVDEKDSIPSHEGIFDPESEWIKFASNNQVTANELLVNRPLVSLKYCRTRPHLFMTAHEYPINIRDLELDLKPYRVINIYILFF